MATVCNYAFSFLTVFYAARVLQPEAMGNVAFASAVVSYFSLLAKMGIPLYGMRSVAACREDKTKLAQLTSELISLGVLFAAGAAALLFATVWLTPELSSFAPLYLIMGVGLVLDGLGCDWLYQGLEQYRFILMRNVIVRLAIFVLLVLLVRGQGDLLWYAALSTLSTTACALVGFAFIPRAIGEEGAPPQGQRRWYARSKKNLLQHIRPSLTFFLMSCATLIYANLDIVMLGFMSTPTEVGYYQIAAKAKVALTALGGIVWNAALPQSTQLWEHGEREKFAALARRTLRFVCVLQSTVTILFFVLAEPAILVAAGDAYLPAVPAFRVLLLSVIPIAVSNILGGQVLIPAGKERLLLASEICGAAANLVLNLVLIPSLGGLGAAMSTVVAEVVVMLGTYLATRASLHLRLFPWDRWLSTLCVPALRGIQRTWYRMTCREERARGYCPCCDTTVPHWRSGNYANLPTAYNPQRYAHTPQNVLCPICGALPRHRIIAWYLSQHPEVVEGKRILYFAPENSMKRWFRRHGIPITTADLFQPADLTLDIQHTGLADASYDVVVCNHVLEHVEDWRRALDELHRILVPEGLLVCSFPIDPTLDTLHEDPSVTSEEERILQFGQCDHLRVFGRDSAQLLKEVGFEVEVLQGAELPARIYPVVGPADYDSSDVFLCRRV